MQPLLFNGKFLAAEPTGVHRAAEETIRAVDRALAAGLAEGPAWLLHPRDAKRLPPLEAIRTRQLGRSTWQLWEQGELPLRAGPGLLINLCNLGPVARRDAITVIHDAQVIETPESYAPAFRAFYRNVQPLIARRHRAVLTVSDYAKGALIRHGVAPADAITVAPNGCDHVFRTAPDRAAAWRFGLSPGSFVLAPASALPHKNIRVLFDAFRRPETAGLTLALFGGADPAEIDPDPPHNVVALGRVTDAELFGLMTTAAAFAAPSTTEGFGLPPLEAMAMGCPVVAAPCGALPETCGPAALFADPHRPAAWAMQLALLARGEAERRRREALGRAQAARFTWDGTARRLLSVVEAHRGPTKRVAA